jgi:hypothetical protein
MFYAPGLVFDGTEGVGSHFHVLRSRTRFQRYRGLLVPFSCFALPDSFSAVPMAYGPIFIFCAPGLVFGGTEGVGSRFHVLRSRTRYRRYRGLGSRFHALRAQNRFRVLRARAHFRRYRGRRVPFSCFTRPDSFSAVPRASGPVFKLCAPGLIFGYTVGVVSRIHVLRARTLFRMYRGRRVPFSCYALPDSFSAEPGHRVPFYCFGRPD